jgi:hypothetical protein
MIPGESHREWHQDWHRAGGHGGYPGQRPNGIRASVRRTCWNRPIFKKVLSMLDRRRSASEERPRLRHQTILLANLVRDQFC